MKKLAMAILVVGCIGLSSGVNATEIEDMPLYSQKEYKRGYDYAATLGANVGIWCMAQHPITMKTKSADAHMAKINKCVEDELRGRGVTFIRDDR